LTPDDAEVFHGIDGLENTINRRVPNYLRTFATMAAAAVQPLAHLVKSVRYSGAGRAGNKDGDGLALTSPLSAGTPPNSFFQTIPS
jgi:hypothetical protein